MQRRPGRKLSLPYGLLNYRLQLKPYREFHRELNRHNQSYNISGTQAGVISATGLYSGLDRYNATYTKEHSHRILQLAIGECSRFWYSPNNFDTCDRNLNAKGSISSENLFHNDAKFGLLYGCSIVYFNYQLSLVSMQIHAVLVLLDYSL